MQSRTAVVIPLDHRVLFVSSLNCADSPVGFPKLPKPSTRSPGFSSDRRGAVGRAMASLHDLSQPVAPGYASGGCGALRSLAVLLV